MKAVRLHAKWAPKKEFKLGAKDINKKQTYLGSLVWKDPVLRIEDIPAPEPGPNEVLIEVRACGICGSDVHMAQPDEKGYIFYPGLTGFPCTLGHEFSGVVAKAGPGAFNKRTMKPFKPGEPVTAEEMIWCARCKPCADGWPNHCERLDELGFNVDGAFAKYVVVPDRVVWSLEPLKKVYKGDDIFLAGSLVEPTSVAYNAVIERGGGIRPGDNVVICGGGPIGQAACACLKRMGAANVIMSEPELGRRKMALALGADHAIDPTTEDLVEKVLKYTDGMGGDIYLEATGLPTIVFPQIEQCVWEGRTLNARVVVVARADAKMPVTGEVFQVRRAAIIGAQGHSGHGTFSRVINCMGDGMDMTAMITRKIKLQDVPKNIIGLRTNRKDCKITCVM